MKSEEFNSVIEIFFELIEYDVIWNICYLFELLLVIDIDLHKLNSIVIHQKEKRGNNKEKS